MIFEGNLKLLKNNSIFYKNSKQIKILEKKKELEKLESERKAKVFFDHLDINKDSILQPDELLVYPELDILFDNDGQFTLEESNVYLAF